MNYENIWGKQIRMQFNMGFDLNAYCRQSNRSTKKSSRPQSLINLTAQVDPL